MWEFAFRMGGFRGTSSAVLLCAALGGCGTPAEVANESVSTAEEAIGGPWRELDETPNQADGFTGSPAVCDARTSMGGTFLVGRSTNNRFRWSLNQRIYGHTAWADLSSSMRLFNSKPTCTSFDEYHQGSWTFNYKKAILGRSTDNRYYIRVVSVPPGPVDPNTNLELPSPVNIGSAFAQISTNTYDSAPAAATVNGKLYVLGRRSNTLYLSTNQLNLSSSGSVLGTWQNETLSVALPSGWTAQGDPAVVNSSPFYAAITFAQRATRLGQTRIWVNFYGGGTSFYGWYQLSTVTAGIASDPALDVNFDWLNALTVYFTGGDGKLYEGSTFFSDPTFTAVNAAGNTNTGLSGSPAAVGWLDAWEGSHYALVPKGNQFVYTSPCPNPNGC